jgi:hypothetical protein
MIGPKSGPISILVFVRPCADVRKGAPPVDAGISPKLDEYDFPVHLGFMFSGCVLSHSIAPPREGKVPSIGN